LGALDSLLFTWGVVRLAGKAPGIYTRLYLARRRTCKAFSRQLVACGVDKSTARELARCYPKIDLIFMGSE
jgi:hypothetical protein